MWKEPKHRREETVDGLVMLASLAKKKPADPPEGIPNQWLPSWVRWPIRIAFWPFVILDMAMQEAARKIIQPPYVQKGHCKKRGNCCHYILLPKPSGILGRIFYFWHTQVNGFFPRESKPRKVEGEEMIVMGCRYLKDDGTCRHHMLRPTLCRQWPIIESFGRPQRLSGCGYVAKPRWHKTGKKEENEQ